MIRHPHLFEFTEHEVRKQFVRWDDGEADREWACLTLLAEHAPGIAPRPLRRDTRDGAPVIVMERLPGTPLPTEPASSGQLRALGETLRVMYAIPAAAVEEADIRERRLGPSTLGGVLLNALVGARAEGCEDPRGTLERQANHVLDLIRRR